MNSSPTCGKGRVGQLLECGARMHQDRTQLMTRRRTDAEQTHKREREWGQFRPVSPNQGERRGQASEKGDRAWSSSHYTGAAGKPEGRDQHGVGGRYLDELVGALAHDVEATTDAMPIGTRRLGGTSMCSY